MSSPAVRANTVRHRVAFGETDAAGVVFYPNYLRWFDQGTHELFRAMAIPLGSVQEKFGVVLPIVSVHADFRAPLRYDDEVEIRSSLDGLTDRTLTVAHQVVRAEREVCAGHEIRGCVAAENGRFASVAIPDDLRRRLS